MLKKEQGQSVTDQVLAGAVRQLAAWESSERQALVEKQPTSTPAAAITGRLLEVVFRHLASVDWLIDQRCRRGVTPDLRNLLRVGITEILYFQAVADAVMTDTCVRYARRAGAKAQAGFVNAVLRGLLRTGTEQLLAEIRSAAPPQVRLELPPELYGRWRRHYPECLADLARLAASPAPLIVRSRVAGAAELAGMKPLPAPDWMPKATLWHCRDATELFASTEFKSGHFYVQDPSTLLAPALLAPQAGETIADLCCAPGGKTLLLADMVGGEARIVAGDRSLRRLAAVRENLNRFYGQTTPAAAMPVQVIAADVAQAPFRRDTFDAILLDVPCSNTGVLRRRPAARWRFSRQALAELTTRQARMLEQAATGVRPGGRLVYSTCSVEPEENGRQVQGFLARHPEFNLDKDRQILPGEYHDGAYAACLRRASRTG